MNVAVLSHDYLVLLARHLVVGVKLHAGAHLFCFLLGSTSSQIIFGIMTKKQNTGVLKHTSVVDLTEDVLVEIFRLIPSDTLIFIIPRVCKLFDGIEKRHRNRLYRDIFIKPAVTSIGTHYIRYKCIYLTYR